MNRTWFITGSGRGIGAAIARAALSAGDNVVATGRKIEALQQGFVGLGKQVLTVPLDVTDETQALSAVEAAVTHFGRIDVLVNNAGYGQFGAFEENEIAEIEKQFATNVFGVFHVTRAVLPVMRQARSGHIFNVSAVGGLVGYPNLSLYSSTKFAVEGFSESLAHEVSAFGIKVTIVEPGFVRTDFLDASSIRHGSKSIPDYVESAAQAKQFAAKNNHQQTGDPDNLAVAIVRLANEANPPLRFLAGSDAFGLATEKLNAMNDEFKRWRKLTISTDGNFNT
jgi:NAD(P)-dependent dehydrogenase (short-subunit alcohol dehydrogenase family)